MPTFGATDPGYVVQTEVTYAPSPRRMGKKKVKLNPIHTVAGELRASLSGPSGGNGYSYPTRNGGGNAGGNGQPPVPLVSNGDGFGANVGVIGCKSKYLNYSYLILDRIGRIFGFFKCCHGHFHLSLSNHRDRSFCILLSPTQYRIRMSKSFLSIFIREHCCCLLRSSR